MWDQIRSNRRRSVVVVGAMGALLVVTGAALGSVFGPAGDEGSLGTGAAVAAVVWLVLWLVAMSSGDRILLAVAGAREIRKADHPRLFNIVEEMTIAARLPAVPRVYVVDDPAPNAFATGRDPARSAVAVTTGLLHILDRDELQGVVAHEVGHIKNRDIRLITIAGIMLGTVVILADIGRRALWYGRRRSRSSSKGNGAEAAVMIVALVLIVLAPLLAQILYFSLSRRREFLADASGAMFTRYPEGLASALEKLGRGTVRLADQNHVTAPMYIVRPAAAGGGGGSLFSTHPPLAVRVRILREMAGGAGFRAYEEASRKVRGKGVLGAQTLGESENIAARAAAPSGDPPPHLRAREAQDAHLAASGWSRLACSCGAVVKIPPEMQARVHDCPRCGAPLPSGG